MISLRTYIRTHNKTITTLYGIVTGDIIHSRHIEAAAREYLYALLQPFLKTLQAEGWLKKVEQTSGNSVQC